MTTAVVPVRALAGAKERLAGVLTPLQRKHLFTAMLQDTLCQLVQHRGIRRTLVVTSDTETRHLAGKLGAEALPEPTRPGLSAAAAHAHRVCLGEGSPFLFVPADLPFLVEQDLDRLLNQPEALDIVLAPAADFGGTNSLLARMDKPFPFAFGRDSFRRHLQLARSGGLNVGVCISRTLGLDLDEPEDLAAAWQEASATATNTGQLMVEYDFPGMIQNKILCS